MHKALQQGGNAEVQNEDHQCCDGEGEEDQVALHTARSMGCLGSTQGCEQCTPVAVGCHGGRKNDEKKKLLRRYRKPWQLDTPRGP